MSSYFLHNHAICEKSSFIPFLSACLSFLSSSFLIFLWLVVYWIPSISFSFPIALARNSNKMLNRSSEYRCFFLPLSWPYGESFHWFTSNTILSIRFSIDVLNQAKKIPSIHSSWDSLLAVYFGLKIFFLCYLRWSYSLLFCLFVYFNDELHR